MPKASQSELLRKNYLLDTKGKVELLKRLQAVRTFLRERQQDDEGKKELESLAGALVHSSITHHKDHDVKLEAACCLADIFRLFAPDAPYDAEKLENNVFPLWIEQLKGLDGKHNDDQRCFYLLEKLSVVKAFVLAIDLSEDIMTELFELFLKRLANSNNSAKTKTHLIDILASLIEEATQLPPSVLDALLLPLLPPNKKDSGGYGLAYAVVNRCAEQLRLPISQFLTDFVIKGDRTDSELKDKPDELIIELSKVSPLLISSVLPSLSEQVLSEHEDERLKAIRLLGKLFVEKDSLNSPQLKRAYESFIGRINDASAEVRLEMIAFLRPFFTNHQQLEKDVIAYLTTRVRDPDERVRKVAVMVICECVSTLDYNKVDSGWVKVMDEVGTRLRDKKPLVRREAVVQLGILYKNLYKKYGLEWPTACFNLCGFIPIKVMHSYFIPQDEVLRFLIEKVLDEQLLPVDEIAKVRTDALLEMSHVLDENALKALRMILSQKKEFRDLFANYLKANKTASNQDEEDEEQGTEKQLSTLLQSLASRLPFPVDKAKEGITKLFEKLEPKTIKLLERLLNEDATYQEVRNAKKELLSGKNVKSFPVLEPIVQRLGMTIISRENIPFIFKHMMEKLQDSDADITAILNFVKELSQVFPSLFRSSVAELHKLLDDDDLRDRALIMISNIGQAMVSEKSQTKKFETKLVELAKTSAKTSHQAKYAIKCIKKISSDKEYHRQFQFISKHIIEAIDQVDSTDYDTLQTYLASLSQMALEDPSIFEAETGNEVAQWVIQSVVLAQEAKQKRKESDKWEASPSCQVVILGLNFLVNYLVSLDEANCQVAGPGIFKILFHIIAAKGKITEDKPATETDQEYLRMKAIGCVLKLARYRHLDMMISPQNFHNLCWAIEDSRFEARESLEDKIDQLQRRNQPFLPSKYLALFAFFANENNKALREKVKIALNSGIRFRRDLLKTSAPSGETPANLPSSTVQMQVLPEYALPYLVHTLAHNPAFDEDKEGGFKAASRYLSFFLGELMHQADNLSFLDQMLKFMQTTEDALEPENTNFHSIVAIAARVHQEKYASKKWGALQVHPGKVYLPPILFKKADAPLSVPDDKYLPADFHLHETRRNAILYGGAETKEQTPKKPKRKSSPKRRSSKKSDDEESSSESKPTSLSSRRRASIPRGAKPTSLKEAKDNSEDEDEESSDKEKKGTKTGTTKSTSGQGRRSSKSKSDESESEEEEKEEDAKAKKGKGKRTSPQKNDKNDKKRKSEKDKEEEDEPEVVHRGKRRRSS